MVSYELGWYLLGEGLIIIGFGTLITHITSLIERAFEKRNF